MVLIVIIYSKTIVGIFKIHLFIITFLAVLFYSHSIFAFLNYHLMKYSLGIIFTVNRLWY